MTTKKEFIISDIGLVLIDKLNQRHHLVTSLKHMVPIQRTKIDNGYTQIFNVVDGGTTLNKSLNGPSELKELVLTAKLDYVINDTLPAINNISIIGVYGTTGQRKPEDEPTIDCEYLLPTLQKDRTVELEYVRYQPIK